MKEIDYKEEGHKLINAARTDGTTAHQLLVAAYDIVLFLSKKYPDPETAADIRDVVAIMGEKESLPKPEWAGPAEAKALAQGLVAVVGHRMSRGIHSGIVADIAAKIDGKEYFSRCDQRRLQSARTMNCLDLLENVIKMDKMLAHHDPREAALIFWDKIFLAAPAYLMEFEEVNDDCGNEALMDKCRSAIWEIVWSYNARFKMY